jgi:ubiquinone/menaquinone biosynthesis C-methylase UbiE
MGVGGIGLVGLALSHASSSPVASTVIALLCGLLLLQTVVSYLYSTRRGKLVVWAELLNDLHLRGNEHVLDMGCGRGAVLSIVAELVPKGRAVGLDLWRSADQTGNSSEAARQNLYAEGVSDRCALETGDMLAMPFLDSTFDLVVSNLAIHNIAPAERRLRAVDEAVRVLKPGGRLMIADLMSAGSYARHLRECGMEGVVQPRLGWRFWFGVLGLATGLVTAVKPTGTRNQLTY